MSNEINFEIREQSAYSPGPMKSSMIDLSFSGPSVACFQTLPALKNMTRKYQKRIDRCGSISLGRAN